MSVGELIGYIAHLRFTRSINTGPLETIQHKNNRGEDFSDRLTVLSKIFRDL